MKIFNNTNLFENCKQYVDNLIGNISSELSKNNITHEKNSSDTEIIVSGGNKDNIVSIITNKIGSNLMFDLLVEVIDVKGDIYIRQKRK